MTQRKSYECPVCTATNERDRKKLMTVNGIDRVQCKVCDTIFFAHDDYKKPVYDLNYNRHFFRVSDIRKSGMMLPTVLQHVGPPYILSRILEVGPGNGLLAFILHEMGYDIECVEIEKDTCNFIATEFGVPMIEGQFESFISEKKYTFIYAAHVLEHSQDPYAFLCRAYECLEPGGKIYIETPDTNFIPRDGSLWHHFDTRNEFEHCTCFNLKALTILAQRCKFEITDVDIYDKFNALHAVLVRK